MTNNSPTMPEKTDGTIRILSHNMAQDQPDAADIDALILGSGADIVFLQEVTGDYIDIHWPLLSDDYPFQIHGPLQDDKRIGMGLLSKYPFDEQKNFKLDPEGLVFQQRVTVDVNGVDVTLYNVHTTFPWMRMGQDPWLGRLPWPIYDDEVRRREVSALATRLRDEKNPVIVAGDFNLTEQSEDYQKLVNVLFDSYGAVGERPGFTWPANRTPSVNIRPAIPIVRIDYIFHTQEFEPVNAHVLSKTGSDHLPILVDITVSGGINNE